MLRYVFYKKGWMRIQAIGVNTELNDSYMRN